MTTKSGLEFDIRDATPADLGFCIDSFENSLRNNYLDATRKDFSNSCRAMLGREMRAGASLYVACCPEVPDQIWGWALARDKAEVIFVYVRHRYRKNGIATALLEWSGFDKADEVTVRFMTHDASQIKWGRRKNLRYIPYL